MSHMSAMFNFEFSILSTCPFKILHFDPNPITIRNLVQEIWAIHWILKQCKTWEYVICFSLSLKINISDIRLIPLDHVTYSYWDVPHRNNSIANFILPLAKKDFQFHKRCGVNLNDLFHSFLYVRYMNWGEVTFLKLSEASWSLSEARKERSIVPVDFFTTTFWLSLRKTRM